MLNLPSRSSVALRTAALCIVLSSITCPVSCFSTTRKATATSSWSSSSRSSMSSSSLPSSLRNSRSHYRLSVSSSMIGLVEQDVNNNHYDGTRKNGKKRRRSTLRDSGAKAMREAMLNHRTLTKEEEWELGEHIQTGARIRKKLEALMEEKKAESDRQEALEGMRRGMEFLYDEPIDESLLLASGQEMDMDGESSELFAFSVYGIGNRYDDDDMDRGDDYLDNGLIMSRDVDMDGDNDVQELMNQERTHWQNRRQVHLHKNKQERRRRRRRQEEESSSWWDVDTVVDNERLLTDRDIREVLGLPNRAALRRVLARATLARETLIRCNVRLVRSIAKKWAMNGKTTERRAALYDGSSVRPSLEEAVQEGIVGLSKAADRYDPTRKLRFSTYSTVWITQSIRVCFQNALTGPLPVSYAYHNIRYSVRKVCREYREAGKPPPSHAVLADRIGVTETRMRRALRYTQPLISLDEPASSGGMVQAGSGGIAKDSLATIGDLIQSTDQKPEEMVDMSLLRQCLENAMASELSPYERDIVRLRFGLDDGVSRTAKQVGEVCGGNISAWEVSSAERRAFTKLRSPHAVHMRELLSYLDSSEINSSIIR